MLAGLADEGVIDGIHLEGPFLSRGALRRPGSPLPDRTRRRRVRRGCTPPPGGWLRMITIAPELPGATAADPRRGRRRA